MSTFTAHPVSGPTATTDGRAGRPVPLGPVVRRRISVPWILLGMTLVLGFAVAGAVLADRVDTRLPVLAAARAVDAGEVIGAGDVKVVRVAADVEVATVQASDLSSVLGRTAAIPLTPGSLLTRAQIGAPVWPPAGQAVIAVAVKAGRAPSGLVPGAQVMVLVVPASTGGSPSAGPGPVAQAAATVVSIEQAADQSGTVVVSLLMATPNAIRIASATGDVSLVQLGGGG